MHLPPQHSSGSKQWPLFMGWELNARENKKWSNLGKHIGPHISAKLPQLSLSWQHLNIHEIHIMLRSCWHKSAPRDWCGTKATMLIVCYKGGDDGEGKKKERLFFLVTVSDCFFSEVLTRKVLLLSIHFFTCHYLLEAYSCRKFTCRCEFSVLTCSWHSKKTYALLCLCSGWRT